MVETELNQQHRSTLSSPPPIYGFGPDPEFVPKEARSDSPPPFHGFGQGPKFESAEASGSINSQPKSKGCRPKGKGKGQGDILAAEHKRPPPSKRRIIEPTNQKPRKRQEPNLLPKQSLPGATFSRPTFYLAGKP